MLGESGYPRGGAVLHGPICRGSTRLYALSRDQCTVSFNPYGPLQLLNSLVKGSFSQMIDIVFSMPFNVGCRLAS